MTHQAKQTNETPPHGLGLPGFGVVAWAAIVLIIIALAALAVIFLSKNIPVIVDREGPNIPAQEAAVAETRLSAGAKVRGFSFCKSTDPGLGDAPFACWQNLNDEDAEGEDGAVIMRNGGTPYAVFSFDRAHGVSRVRILTDVGIRQEAQWLKDFRVEVSEDGSQYREVLQGVKAQAPGFEEFPLPPNVTARYVKVLFASNYGDRAWTQVGEVEVYGVK